MRIWKDRKDNPFPPRTLTRAGRNLFGIEREEPGREEEGGEVITFHRKQFRSHELRAQTLVGRREGCTGSSGAAGHPSERSWSTCE